MQACIDECLRCPASVCLHEATMHCLEAGGEDAKSGAFRLMLNCAEICQTSANFMLSGSEIHKLTCGVCAEVCRRCAADCERGGEMDECVQACHSCAESCERMAA